MASSPISAGVVRFGVFEADLRGGELRRNGVKVRLQDLPFRALTLLLTHPGVVITREEFRQSLWPADVFVDFEQGISSAIMRLRDALGDSAENPIFIQTVERRGYRWIGPVLTQTLQPATPNTVPMSDRPAEPERANNRRAEQSSVAESETAGFTARYEMELGNRSSKPTPGIRLWLFVGVVGVVAISAAVFFLRSSQRVDPISSIAILPFDNLSAPAFDDAFSDGLTDEVASSISQLPGIRVAGRRSAYVFKGKHDDLRSIGSRLNVEAVVEGSVQRSGDRSHVTVELNRTRDGFTIWSQTYDGTTADWIQVESQIANSIARALTKSLLPAAPATHDPEAHAQYLEARYLWNQRTFQSELKSVDLLQQAIARDPNYALAWAALADSLIAIGDIEPEVDPKDYMPRARDAAQKALRLDPSLAEAHAALGMVACHYDFDWPTAEREYKKAFELNPSYASAHQYYALGLMAHGRFAEAEAQLDTARRLDPLALIVDVDLALLRKFQRDFDGVIAVSKSVLERDPNYRFGISMLSVGYLCEHRWDDFLVTIAKSPHENEVAAAVVRGQRDEQERLLRQAMDQVHAGQLRPYFAASDALLMGRNSLALDLLEKSYDHHDYWLLFTNVDPQWDPVRSDPRFQSIMRRLGL